MNLYTGSGKLIQSGIFHSSSKRSKYEFLVSIKGKTALINGIVKKMSDAIGNNVDGYILEEVVIEGNGLGGDDDEFSPTPIYLGNDGEPWGGEPWTPDGGSGGSSGAGSFTANQRAQLLTLENDYKGRMSPQELSIYNSMSLNNKFSYLTNAYAAEVTAMSLFPGSQLNRKADAFRHALFHASNSVTIGITLSTGLGNAHEANAPADRLMDKQMDLHNNAFGRTFLKERGPNERAGVFILNAIDNGDLMYLSPLTTSGGIIPEVTKLIPTNQ